jgi:hypothetical protein
MELKGFNGHSHRIRRGNGRAIDYSRKEAPLTNEAQSQEGMYR